MLITLPQQWINDLYTAVANKDNFVDIVAANWDSGEAGAWVEKWGRVMKSQAGVFKELGTL